MHLSTQTCNRCLFDSKIAFIHSDGECEYCKLSDKLSDDAKSVDFEELLNKIAHKGRAKKYDCLIGISGGIDSSTLLYAAVKKFGLNPMVIHFDNKFNAPEAEENMRNLCDYLGVYLHRFKTDFEEYFTLNMAFIHAGLPDADIPNDIAMTKIMYEVAQKEGIKYILNGHDFRTEGSTPKGWTYMDAKYIQSVYKWFTGKELTSFPLFTIKDQIIAGLRGVKQIRPFYYHSYLERIQIEEEMKRNIGFKDYGGKHCENVYTEYVGGYYLPTYFKMDKRIVYLSALVRSGIKTKEEALLEFEQKHFFDFSKFDDTTQRIIAINEYAKAGLSRQDFKKYNFKRYRPLIWIMAKLGVVPYTFYAKYAK